MGSRGAGEHFLVLHEGGTSKWSGTSRLRHGVVVRMRVAVFGSAWAERHESGCRHLCLRRKSSVLESVQELRIGWVAELRRAVRKATRHRITHKAIGRLRHTLNASCDALAIGGL